MTQTPAQKRKARLDADVQRTLSTHSISKTTLAYYNESWGWWEAVCEELDLAPDTDSFAPVNRLFECAVAGRRPATTSWPKLRTMGRARTSPGTPLSVSGLECILAAIRYQYAVLGLTAPHLKPENAELTRQLKKGYFNLFAERGTPPQKTNPLRESDMRKLMAWEPAENASKLVLLAVIRTAIERRLTPADAAALAPSDVLAIAGATFLRDRVTGELALVACTCSEVTPAAPAQPQPRCVACLLNHATSLVPGHTSERSTSFLASAGLNANGAFIDRYFRRIEKACRYFSRGEGGVLSGGWQPGDEWAQRGSLITADLVVLDSVALRGTQARVALSWSLGLRASGEAGALKRTDLSLTVQGALLLAPTAPVNAWGRTGPGDHAPTWSLESSSGRTSPYARIIEWMMLLDCARLDPDPRPLFPSVRNGRLGNRPQPSSTVHTAFKRLAEASGVSGLVPASVFAGYALTLLERGVDEVTALERLRLRQPRHLDRHLKHARRPAVANAIANIDDAAGTR